MGTAGMPDYRRYFVLGGTYFFTVVTYQRRPLFSDRQNVERLGVNYYISGSVASSAYGFSRPSSEFRSFEFRSSAEFRRVHAGCYAEFGGGQRGDAQIQIHLASGDQKLVYAADIATGHDAGRHATDQV